MPEFKVELTLDLTNADIIELIRHVSNRFIFDGEWPEEKKIGFEQDYILNTDDMENILREACPEFVLLLDQIALATWESKNQHKTNGEQR